MTEEAQDYIDSFIRNYEDEMYKEAGADLAMAYLCLEVCEDLIKAKMDPDIVAGKKDDSVYFPDITAGTESINEGTNKEGYWEYSEALDSIAIFKEKLLNISNLIKIGETEKVTLETENALQEIKIVSRNVKNTVNVKSLEYLEFSDIPTSLYFLQSSIRSIQELINESEQTDQSIDEISEEIYLSKLSLSIGKEVLENQKITYWWYYYWQGLQDYNLNIQSFEIALEKSIQDIRNTVIVAPSDGTVVAVELKRGYILSAQDYSSRAAVELVDTTRIKFTGMVDEIDILKVERGQKAYITVDAVPDKVFTGKVKFISPYGTKDGQVVKFAVTIELDPTDVELRGSLSASADIDVYKATNVLLVPVSALNATTEGYTVTVINAAGQPEVKKIEVGNQNFQYAEVLSGLKEGDKLMPATATPSSVVTRFGPPPGR
jgi:multidrug efflux pump subunit AcrA (membrane-fusion protein)